MAASHATYLRQRPYLAVSLTHFFVDVLNSGRNLLVAVLAISLGLSNAQVGIALLLYNAGSALSQPLFGWLADRIGARLLVIGGMGWMIFFYVIASLAGDWPALAALTIASLGSGAFHPTGTMVASRTSQTKRSQATALFFMAGQIGLFVGPLLTGIVLEAYGRPGYLALPVLSLVAFVSGWQWLSHKHEHKPDPGLPQTAVAASSVSRVTAVSPAHTNPWRRVLLLALIILMTNTVSIATITFTPKLFTELNYDPTRVGWLSGLFMLGSAIGGLTGGTLGDRMPGKWVIAMGMGGLVLPVFFYVPAAGLAQALLLLLAGFFGGMPHTILVIMVQSLLPRRQAMASGLALGFMFFGGAVGSYVVGFVADGIGLGAALQNMALLPFIGLAAAVFLPRK